MDFSEKLKQIRKSEGKPFGYSDNSYWLYFTNRGGGRNCHLINFVIV